MPSDISKTMPTYQIKACYQLPGDKFYQTIDERLATGRPFSEVVVIEISLNDVLCETRNEQLSPEVKLLRVCTLEDIIAEKLRALLQQITRGRNRPQDVFDIATMSRKHSGKIDHEKVSKYLIRKSEARTIVASKGSFNAAVRDQALLSYDDEIRDFTDEFIPFDEAWEEVLRFVSRLMISE